MSIPTVFVTAWGHAMYSGMMSLQRVVQCQCVCVCRAHVYEFMQTMGVVASCRLLNLQGQADSCKAGIAIHRRMSLDDDMDEDQGPPPDTDPNPPAAAHAVVPAVPDSGLSAAVLVDDSLPLPASDPVPAPPPTHDGIEEPERVVSEASEIPVSFREPMVSGGSEIPTLSEAVVSGDSEIPALFREPVVSRDGEIPVSFREPVVSGHSEILTLSEPVVSGGIEIPQSFREPVVSEGYEIPVLSEPAVSVGDVPEGEIPGSHGPIAEDSGPRPVVPSDRDGDGAMESVEHAELVRKAKAFPAETRKIEKTVARAVARPLTSLEAKLAASKAKLHAQMV